MKLIDIIIGLRKELSLFKTTNTFAQSTHARDIVFAIEKAILLIEDAETNRSKIMEKDKIWFKGAYQVTREFEENEWRKIGLLYDKLVEKAESEFW